MRSNNEEDNLAKTIQFIALIFIAFLMVLALTPTYRIQNGASADLLWNKNEAYIFVNTYHKGWQMSSLHYLGATLREYFNTGTPYAEKQTSILVLHLNGDRVDQYAVKNISLDFYTPWEGSIYANSNGSLMRWTGSSFEKASSGDQEKFNNAKQHRSLGATEDGWTINRLFLTGDREKMISRLKSAESNSLCWSSMSLRMQVFS
jgi:hypothetical protein